MDEYTKRKEVWLTEVEISRLQELADKRKWSLKQYMEMVLSKESRKAVNILPKFKSKQHT